MKERDRYLKIVEWSEEDQCYIGSVPGWIGKCCHGKMKKKFIENFVKLLMNGLKPMPTTEGLFPTNNR